MIYNSSYCPLYIWRVGADRKLEGGVMTANYFIASQNFLLFQVNVHLVLVIINTPVFTPNKKCSKGETTTIDLTSKALFMQQQPRGEGQERHPSHQSSNNQHGSHNFSETNYFLNWLLFLKCSIWSTSGTFINLFLVFDQSIIFVWSVATKTLRQKLIIKKAKITVIELGGSILYEKILLKYFPHTFDIK